MHLKKTCTRRYILYSLGKRRWQMWEAGVGSAGDPTCFFQQTHGEVESEAWAECQQSFGRGRCSVFRKAWPKAQG